MNTSLQSAQCCATTNVVHGAASARLLLGDRSYINFAGSTYLALGGHHELRAAALKAIHDGVAFSCQLPSVYGPADPAIRDLEITVAKYCGKDDAVYMPSGYHCGVAALTATNITESMLFIDEGAHYSLFDAARLSARPVTPFKHCDPGSLAECIHNMLPPRVRPIVMTDGVFGTTGRVAPLREYAAVVAGHEGHLVIDEAHGFGVVGEGGRGAAEYHGVESVATAAATLSKAFCAQGAIIACHGDAADRIRRQPPLRGVNAGSPISAAVAAAAVRYIQVHPERRTRLAELTGYLRRKLKAIGIETIDSPAPIVAFRMGDRKFMQSVQERLFSWGIYVLLSNYIGAGPDGILRCAVFADHSEADLDALTEKLAAL